MHPEDLGEERLEARVCEQLKLDEVALYAPPVDDQDRWSTRTGITAFQFDLTDELPSVLEGVDISMYLQGAGVNPERLLLEVATELDEDRRDTVALIESSTQEEHPNEIMEEAEPPPPDPCSVT